MALDDVDSCPMRLAGRVARSMEVLAYSLDEDLHLPVAPEKTALVATTRAVVREANGVGDDC